MRCQHQGVANRSAPGADGEHVRRDAVSDDRTQCFDAFFQGKACRFAGGAKKDDAVTPLNCEPLDVILPKYLIDGIVSVEWGEGCGMQAAQTLGLHLLKRYLRLKARNVRP